MYNLKPGLLFFVFSFFLIMVVAPVANAAIYLDENFEGPQAAFTNQGWPIAVERGSSQPAPVLPFPMGMNLRIEQQMGESPILAVLDRFDGTVDSTRSFSGAKCYKISSGGALKANPAYPEAYNSGRLWQFAISTNTSSTLKPAGTQIGFFRIDYSVLANTDDFSPEASLLLRLVSNGSGADLICSNNGEKMGTLTGGAKNWLFVSVIAQFYFADLESYDMYWSAYDPFTSTFKGPQPLVPDPFAYADPYDPYLYPALDTGVHIYVNSNTEKSFVPAAALNPQWATSTSGFGGTREVGWEFAAQNGADIYLDDLYWDGSTRRPTNDLFAAETAARMEPFDKVVDNVGTGTLIINVTPDTGSWSLTGPAGFSPLSHAVGDMTLTGILGGVYHLVFDDNVASKSPPAPQDVSVVDGDIATVNAVYLDTGVITVDVTPNTAAWTLSGPPGFTPVTHTGDQTLYDTPLGDFYLTCNSDLERYEKPDPTTKTLSAGESVTFSPSYRPLSKMVIDVTPDEGVWTLTTPGGMADIMHHQGDMTIDAPPPGFYFFNPEEIPFYDAPYHWNYFEMGSTGTLTLTANYIPTSVISVDVTPERGSWTVTGPNGYSRPGSGDDVLEVPLGTYKITCNDNIAMYDPPPPQIKDANHFTTTVFDPVYVIGTPRLVTAAPIAITKQGIEQQRLVALFGDNFSTVTSENLITISNGSASNTVTALKSDPSGHTAHFIIPQQLAPSSDAGYPTTMMLSLKARTRDSVNAVPLALYLQGDWNLGQIQTGQKESYATGDDGWYANQGLGMPRSFTSTDMDKTLTDNNTGLVWGVGHTYSLPKALPWREAMDTCDSLVYAGYDDWRMPTVEELLSFMSSKGLGGLPGAYIYSVAWAGPDGGCWTSSSGGPNGEWAWIARMSAMMGADKIYGNAFIPVRGGRPPKYAKMQDTDGGQTVTDATSGLTWVKDASQCGGAFGSSGSPTSLTLATALQASEGLDYAGHSDWRMPTVNELESNMEYFPVNTPLSIEFAYYNPDATWSSTRSSYTPWFSFTTTTLTLSPISGCRFPEPEYSPMRVHPVRGGFYLTTASLSIPDGFRAVGGADSIRLFWKRALNSGMLGYNLYQSTSKEVGYSRLNTEPIAATQYVDPNVTIGTTYYYRLASVNSNGTESRLTAPSSAKAGSVTLKMPNYYGKSGSTVTLQINCDNADGISDNGLDIGVSYNKNILTPLTAERTALTKTFTVTDNVATANGNIRIQGSSSSVVHATGAGHLFDVVFQVAPDLPYMTSMTHTFTSAILKNPSGNALSVDATDTATFTVKPWNGYADSDGDGIVSWVDIRNILWHACGRRFLADLTDDNPGPDMNGDGIIDSVDAMLVLRMEFGWDIHPYHTSSSASARVQRMASSASYAFSIPDMQAYPAARVLVPVQVNNASSIAALDLDITYNGAILALDKVSKTDLTNEFQMEYVSHFGGVAISMCGVNPLSAGNGDIVILEFAVLGKAGDITSLAISDCKAANVYGEDLSWQSAVTVAPGTFTVKPVPSGTAVPGKLWQLYE